MTEVSSSTEIDENINPAETKPPPNYSRSLIKSILDSTELSNVVDLKLSKYINAPKKVCPDKKDKDYISKLEEGYESSDSGDSVQSTSSALTSTTSSTYSGLSYMSQIPNELNNMIENEPNNNQQRVGFGRIFNEIKLLKTIIPEEKKQYFKEKKDNNKNNINKNEFKSDKKENKGKKEEINYPLEYYEIFPNLPKYKVGNETNSESIEKPVSFVKNLILKNYNESPSYIKNKFILQNFKNSINYRYKIMNKIQTTVPKDNSENITCMINGIYQNNNIDKKNKEINDVKDVIKKLSKSEAIESVELNFIFFGYKNGLIRQNILTTEKQKSPSDSILPVDGFLPYREYSISEIITERQLDKHVLCMSLSENGDYLLAGYASGHIIIWNTTNGKYLYVFDEIFEMPVVSCEFLWVSENNKEFYFLAGDLIGKVYLIQFQKNLIMKDDVNKIVVSNCFYPCLLIKKLKFNKYDGDSDFNINNIINKIDKNDFICIIGNLEYIEIISIGKRLGNIESKFLIRNPDLVVLNPMTEEIKKDRNEFYSQASLKENLSKIDFPDACFGLGYLGELDKFCENKKNPDILFAYSWKNEIKLFYFFEKSNEFIEIGWYLNNSPIIKIDFIGVSLLYLLDKNNNIKIINIKLFNNFLNSNSKAMKDDKNRRKNKFLIPVSDIISLENPVKTISKTFTETINFYNPFIIKNKYNIYLIEDLSNKSLNSSKNFQHIHLLSYREFFNEMMIEKNWLLFFCKFIDIIKTGTNTFGCIPENRDIKENLLIEKEPNKIVKYNYLKYFLLENKSIFDEDEDFFENNENNFDYLSVAIEFATEIGSIDFVYNEIKKMENKSILKKKLAEQLEIFILNNKFQNDQDLISQKLINDIVDLYLPEKAEELKERGDEELVKLDLILCHLHTNIIKKIEDIENIIEEKKLFSSFIYYYSNCLNDFVKPLKYLFSEFVKLEPLILPKENFVLNYFKRLKLSRGYYRDNYYTLLKGLKAGNFILEKNLFKTKEYVGHLLFFYVQLTLKEKLFPHLGPINIDNFESVKQEMFLFLTKKEVAEELIKFDSYSYFETLIMFFFQEDEINKMSNDEMIEKNLGEDDNNEKLFLMIDKFDIEKLKENIEGYNNIIDNKIIKKDNKKNISNKEKNNEINQIENETKNHDVIIGLIVELINRMILLCNKFPDNILIKFDLNIFIIHVSLKLDGFSKDILKSSLVSIFNFYNEIKKLKLNLNALSSFFERIDRFGNHYTFIRRKQSALDSISSIINLFINKYYIKNNKNTDELKNLYKLCFSSDFLGVKIYLYQLKKDYVSCIDVYKNEKKKISRRVFPFIDKTLNIIKNTQDEKKLQQFKNKIKKEVTNLARVSQSETFKIIQKWFNSIDIISSLNNLPKLQFRYIDKLKSIYKRKLKREKEVINDKTKKEYGEILLIYIKLLLYFEKEKRALKLIKDEEEYINVNDCLKICVDKSIEVSIYLYKLIGDEKSALKMCLNRIKQNYKEIKLIKDRINTIDERTDELFKEIKILIDESIEICENYSENSEKYKKRRNSSLNLEDKKNDVYPQENEMGEDFWLELFGELYNILRDAEKKEALIFSKIKNHFSEKIENLLISMSYYASFNFILKNVSNELEFSLIKKFLNKNIYTKSHLENLYKSYINLVSYKINKDMNVAEKNGQKGKNVNLIIKDNNQINLEKRNLIYQRLEKYKYRYNYKRTNSFYDLEIQKKENKIKKIPNIFVKCSLCSKNLNFINEKSDVDKNIIIFKCDHIFHSKCLKKAYSNIAKNLKEENDLENNFCPKCINIDTELFIFISDKKEIQEENDDESVEENENNIIINNENLNDKDMNFNAVEEKRKRIEEKMKKKTFKKLAILDNDYVEQINILENTLDAL